MFKFIQKLFFKREFNDTKNYILEENFSCTSKEIKDMNNYLKEEEAKVSLFMDTISEELMKFFIDVRVSQKTFYNYMHPDDYFHETKPAEKSYILSQLLWNGTLYKDFSEDEIKTFELNYSEDLKVARLSIEKYTENW